MIKMPKLILNTFSELDLRYDYDKLVNLLLDIFFFVSSGLILLLVHSKWSYEFFGFVCWNFEFKFCYQEGVIINFTIFAAHHNLQVKWLFHILKMPHHMPTLSWVYSLKPKSLCNMLNCRNLEKECNKNWIILFFSDMSYHSLPM